MPGTTPAGTRGNAVTSGSDTRPPRPLRQPVRVDLAEESRSLRAEPEWLGGDRNARTVATTNRMRIVLTALRSGAEIGSADPNDTLTVQVLEGRVTAEVDAMAVELEPGGLTTIERTSSWRVRAEADSLILLTSAMAVPETDPED
jgi:quercetin dioxygenase-like cupin family protein